MNASNAHQHISHPKYRSDIDGLRAIAVLSVVIFHAYPKSLKGGFIGVDIFFVISGFLISTIIFDSMRRGTFGFLEFYGRRIRRIFPSLVVVLIATYAIGWFLLPANEYKELGKHIFGGAAFISNLVLLDEIGYFDNLAELKPLLNLWSLGVEEQFYIVWPIFLWLAWRARANIFNLSLAILVISFLLNIITIRGNIGLAFFSPQTRFWELLAGSILAYANLYKDIVTRSFKKLINIVSFLPSSGQPNSQHQSTSRDIRSLIGIVFILIGVLITKKNHFPGWWALIPVLGTVLVISAGPKGLLNRTLLSNSILVWFGKISFPLYLWHWPLLYFARIIEGELPSVTIRTGVVCLSALLAWLTYVAIEKPVRFGDNFRIKTLASIAALIITGYLGYNTHQRHGLEFRARGFAKISKAVGEWDFPGKLEAINWNGNKFLYKQSGKRSITLFIGDSNIAQYYPRIDELISKYPDRTNTVVFSTEFGCLPIPGARFEKSKHCEGLLEKSMEIAMTHEDVSTVVIGGYWFSYFSGNGTNITVDGVTYPIVKNGEGYELAMAKLSNLISQLKEKNKRVILMLNIPVGIELDPKLMIKRSIKDFPHVLQLQTKTLEVDDLMANYGKIRQDLKEIAETNKISFIDPIDFLCDARSCPGVDRFGEPIYKDSAHLRPSFVRYNASFIDSTVSE